jgi:hypothetical protein
MLSREEFFKWWWQRGKKIGVDVGPPGRQAGLSAHPVRGIGVDRVSQIFQGPGLLQGKHRVF